MALRAPVMPAEGLPRVGVLPEATSRIEEAYKAAHDLGITLWPWQVHALSVQTSTLPDGKWRYREVADVVARQNGKSKMIPVRVLMGLYAGERILHTAQNRILPREAFMVLMRALPPGVATIRQANGQEEIVYRETGGSYKIIAPQRGARGFSADLLIIDELREYEDFDFIAAAEPTLSASPNPQLWYLSNAGTEQSVVLNDLRNRASTDPQLAYLEWSASPEYAIEDERGWAEANPSIGYGQITIERLRQLFNKYRLAGESAVFETEHGCRWVVSMAPRLLTDVSWQQARGQLEDIRHPHMGISVDPDGTRAHAALAWQQSDGTIGVMITAQAVGEPMDVEAFAQDLVPQARTAGVRSVGFSPWTDQHLARHFDSKLVKPIQSGQTLANASERFVRAVETGKLHWQWADAISEDLPFTARKPLSAKTWQAERAKADRPITAVLAAIYAVWQASEPIERPRLY